MYVLLVIIIMFTYESVCSAGTLGVCVFCRLVAASSCSSGVGAAGERLAEVVARRYRHSVVRDRPGDQGRCCSDKMTWSVRHREYPPNSRSDLLGRGADQSYYSHCGIYNCEIFCIALTEVGRQKIYGISPHCGVHIPKIICKCNCIVILNRRNSI